MDLRALFLLRGVLFEQAVRADVGELHEGVPPLSSSKQLDAWRSLCSLLVVAVLSLLCATMLVSGCAATPGPSATGTDARPPETGRGISSAAVSPDGRQIAISVVRYARDHAASAGLWLIDAANGSPTVVLELPALELRTPSWSADSRRVAVTCDSYGASGVKVLSLERLQLMDVVGPDQGRFYFGPCISPDGSQVAYVRVGDGIPTICVAPVDGLAPPTELVIGKAFDDIGPMSLSWSPGGERVYYLSPSRGEARVVDSATGGVTKIGALPAKGFGGRTVPSPDGRWLLCTGWAADGGADGVWLMSVASGNVTVLSSASPRPDAAWSPTGSHVVWGEVASQKDCGLSMYDVSTGQGGHLTGPGEQDEVAGQHAWTEDDRVFFIRDRSAVMVVPGGGGMQETEIWNASAAMSHH